MRDLHSCVANALKYAASLLRVVEADLLKVIVGEFKKRLSINCLTTNDGCKLFG